MRCKVCGEKWHPRKGTKALFINVHISEHGLVEPVKQEDETFDDFIERYNKFLTENFDL